MTTQLLLDNRRMTNTAGLLLLAAASVGRNRSVDVDEFKKLLDPEGIHLLTMRILHNEVEWRTLWLVKMANEKEPHQVFLDVPMGGLLDNLTVAIETH